MALFGCTGGAPYQSSSQSPKGTHQNPNMHHGLAGLAGAWRGLQGVSEFWESSAGVRGGFEGRTKHYQCLTELSRAGLSRAIRAHKSSAGKCDAHQGVPGLRVADQGRGRAPQSVPAIIAGLSLAGLTRAQQGDSERLTKYSQGSPRLTR
eukprot:3342592-Pyramimonas_sp.AAC.1